MAKRVFFSFHYQDVVDFRANVVRRHNEFSRDEAGYYDASMWEEAKKEGDIALKRLINRKLKYTSNTCVLIGSETYARRWVRYEIIKSIMKGNHLFAVHINGIRDKYRRTKPLGPNPLDYLAVVPVSAGLLHTTVYPIHYTGGSWVPYEEVKSQKTFKIPYKIDKPTRLSDLYPTYKWDKLSPILFPTWLR